MHAPYLQPMTMLFLLAAAAAAAIPPRPLSEAEAADIGCIATFALIAERQRDGAADAARWPDLRTTGRTYAGLVGARITADSGQPREVVALAIRVAYDALRLRSAAGPAPIDAAFAACRDGLAANGSTLPLPPPRRGK